MNSTVATTNWIKEHKEGTLLSIKVVPRARVTAITAIEGEELKIAVASPPVDGAANEALIKYLSKCLKVTQDQLVIKIGATSKHKVILIKGISLHNIKSVIEQSIHKGKK